MRVASAENIVPVQLDPSSTTSDYVMRFLNQVMIGPSATLSFSNKFEARLFVTRRCGKCGTELVAESTEALCPRRATG